MRARVGAVVVGAALGLMLVAPLGAAAGKKPDLTVVKVKDPPGSLTAGESFKAGFKTKNKGKRRAKRSKTGLLLSANEKREAADTRLGQKAVGALKPGKAETKSKQIAVPASTEPGEYFLLACADAKRKVKEKKEGNNCGASKSKIAIEAARSPDPGPDPTPEPGPPAAPIGLVATTVSNAQIDLAWSAVSGATSYSVLRSAMSGGGYAEVGTAFTNAFPDSGLAPNTTYYYVVTAIGPTGQSGPSSEAATTTDFTCTDSAVTNESPGTDLGEIEGQGGLESTTFGSSICRGGDVDWFTIEVTEGSGFPTPDDPFSVRFTLTPPVPPPGRNGNLDLCVYVFDIQLECSVQPGNTPEVVEHQWDDEFGEDDARTFTAKVFGAAANATSAYGLKVEGDVNP